MRILMITISMLVLMGCAHTQAEHDAFAVEHVGAGVYVHHGAHLDIDTGYQGDICNISFVVGSKGVAVIDTGGSLKVGTELRMAIRKVTSLPVLYVINTHVHPDHIYGNAAFLTKNSHEPEPIFVGHEKLAKAMELRKEQYARLNARLLGDDAKGSDLVKPTLSVKTDLVLDLGDRTLTLTAHPNAHTNTDISLLDSKTGTLFTGDLLFIERTPVVEGDIKGLIAEIEKLKSSPAKLVVPGHGPVATDWVTALSNEQRYLNVLLKDIRASIKNNDGMVKAMDTAAASEKGKWKLFDIANRRNVNTLYPALEWE
ncbi:hydroxyacylglutathione hydrolase [mine drainage metagenome]|uniref:Hydroxyacylglutathione hydrolase n=1 Tax=mine drainage metagenome TaxID=410659 RepID=A0A1J5S4Q8_9ZZZZ